MCNIFDQKLTLIQWSKDNSLKNKSKHNGAFNFTHVLQKKNIHTPFKAEIELNNWTVLFERHFNIHSRFTPKRSTWCTGLDDTNGQLWFVNRTSFNRNSVYKLRLLPDAWNIFLTASLLCAQLPTNHAQSQMQRPFHPQLGLLQSRWAKLQMRTKSAQKLKDAVNNGSKPHFSIVLSLTVFKH